MLMQLPCSSVFPENIPRPSLTCRQKSNARCGCDYGSTSFTTVEQVDSLGSMLALTPGKHLPDIGAGAGWPG
jgi:hypothetical protein